MHHSTPARARRLSDAMRVNTLRSRMRQIKPTVGADPWHGGPSTLPGRHGCSCGYGSRASWHDVGCSVGRCASRNPPLATLGGDSADLQVSQTKRHTDWPLVRRRDKTVVAQDYGPALDCVQVGSVFGLTPHLLACALLAPTRLVHIVWTSVWTRPGQWEGDAGERP